MIHVCKAPSPPRIERWFAQQSEASPATTPSTFEMASGTRAPPLVTLRSVRTPSVHMWCTRIDGIEASFRPDADFFRWMENGQTVTVRYNELQKLIGYLPPPGPFLFRTKLSNTTPGFCFLWKLSA